MKKFFNKTALGLMLLMLGLFTGCASMSSEDVELLDSVLVSVMEAAEEAEDIAEAETQYVQEDWQLSDESETAQGDVLESEAESEAKSLSEAREEALVEEAQKTENTLAALETSLDEVHSVSQKKQGELDILQEQLGNMTAAEIAEKRNVLKTEIEQAVSSENTLMEAWQKTREEKERTLALEQQAKAEAEQAKTEARFSQKEWEQSLIDHGFSDQEEYFALLTERSVLEAEEEANRCFFTNLVLLKQAAETLKQQCEQKERKNLSVLFEKQQILHAEKEQKKADADAIRERAAILSNLLTNAEKELTLRRKAEKEYLPVMELSRTANGELAGKDKIAFEQFVQGFYFQKILQAANLRLKDMTEGRYILLHAQKAANKRSQAGLEVEVLDHYTGKSRSVRSLSGGEAFKASLCLALGLSDVIQAHAGGVRIDTMFIDEGFGSLDDRSREQAVEVLQKLSYGDRLVGIISHVSELKETIDKKIIVKKGSAGSTVELNV